MLKKRETFEDDCLIYVAFISLDIYLGIINFIHSTPALSALQQLLLENANANV